ncbi:MAG TPA: hypothetical protein VGM90_32890 [Kofleriaceae bacterium]
MPGAVAPAGIPGGTGSGESGAVGGAGTFCGATDGPVLGRRGGGAGRGGNCTPVGGALRRRGAGGMRRAHATHDAASSVFSAWQKGQKRI